MSSMHIISALAIGESTVVHGMTIQRVGLLRGDGAYLVDGLPMSFDDAVSLAELHAAQAEGGLGHAGAVTSQRNPRQRKRQHVRHGAHRAARSSARQRAELVDAISLALGKGRRFDLSHRIFDHPDGGKGEAVIVSPSDGEDGHLDDTIRLLMAAQFHAERWLGGGAIVVSWNDKALVAPRRTVQRRPR